MNGQSDPKPATATPAPATTPAPEPAPEMGAVLTQIANTLGQVSERLEKLENKPPTSVDPLTLLDQFEDTSRTARQVDTQVREQDLERMTSTQLAQFIVQNIGEEYIQPLTNRVEALRIKLEIAETASKYKDFWEYKDQVWAIGKAKPMLSVEEAYLIATGKAPKKETPPTPTLTPTPRPTPKPPLGEKPNTTTPTTTEVPKTTAEAAAKAFADVFEQTT